MARTVTIVGTTFPVEIRPGAEIEYTDPTAPDPFVVHRGTVWDRAPQGGEQGRYSPRPWEKNGMWLWVIPEGGRSAVRVRYVTSGRNAGQAYHDDAPYVVRTTNGLCWSHEIAAERITREQGLA